MIKKITNVNAGISVGISTIALTAALISSGAFAHGGGHIADGSGNKISDGFGNCINSNNGVDIEACNPKPEPAPEPKPEPPKPVVKVPPKPAPVPPKPQKVVTTENLSGDATFGNNSAALTDEGKSALDTLVSKLSGVEPVKIMLTGHADSRGADAYNQKLSERRAKSVADYIIAKGIPASIVSWSGAGESQPIASNNTAQGRAANRRVEIEVTANKTVYK